MIELTPEQQQALDHQAGPLRVVDPRTNAEAIPLLAPASATASWTLRVMSTMSEWPRVESWIWLVCTGTPGT